MPLRLPTVDELDQVAVLIAGPGVEYAALGPDQRATVLRLAIMADMSDSLTELLSDTRHIGDWFRVSRVWDGP